MSFGKRLKEARKKLKLTQKELAEKIGVTRPAVTQWENDLYEPDNKTIALLAKILNVSTDYLHGISNNNIIPLKRVPLIGYASCGVPTEYNYDTIDEFVPVANEIYIDGMYAVTAQGDSMSPKIEDGDILYCIPLNSIDELKNGDIIHYTFAGESGIKQYKINHNKTIISLIPINPHFEPILIHYDDPFVDTLKFSKVVARLSKFV